MVDLHMPTIKNPYIHKKKRHIVGNKCPKPSHVTIEISNILHLIF